MQNHSCSGCGGCGQKKITVKNIVAQYKDTPGALIPVLQKIQDEFGYVSEQNMKEVSRELGIPLSEVFGVFSFYSQFRDKPPAKFTIDVCMGTACYVLGGGDVLNEFCSQLGIKQGETSEDGMWKIMGSRCLGCCGLAPVVSVNGKIHGHMKRADVAKIIEQCKGGK